MPTTLNLPKIGVNMTEALIVEWVVKEGDEIHEGDHILNAETDKMTQEIFATASGRLAMIIAGNGKKVQVHEPIAVLIKEGEAFNPDVVVKIAESSSEYMAETVKSAVKPGSRMKISPLAKKMAGDLGIDVNKLSPAEPGLRIVKDDIKAYRSRMQNAVVETSGEYDVITFTGIRKIIAQRLTDSNVSKPAAALTLQADAGKLIEWRDHMKDAGNSIGYNEMFALIVSRALKLHPIINSVLTGNEIRLLKNINIGIAIDTEKGLMVPVIRNADKKGLMDIHMDLTEKIERLKNGKATSDDMTGGTFTITNLGMYEIEQFTPIINPPECCILAVGAITKQAVVNKDDTISARPRMQLTLAFDHRIVDGAPAAKFLQTVKHMIESPLNLLS